MALATPTPAPSRASGADATGQAPAADAARDAAEANEPAIKKAADALATKPMGHQADKPFTPASDSLNMTVPGSILNPRLWCL